MSKDSPSASLEFQGVHYTSSGELAAAMARVDGPKTVVVHRPASESRLRVDELDRQEARDRARTVRHILERCTTELERLERIPHLSADELDAMSMAKGFASRAQRALGRFQ